MRVKVDEDLPKAAVQMLRDRGYKAVSVMEQGMGGYKDPLLWQAVQAEGRFLVTADKGFADIRLYAPGTQLYYTIISTIPSGFSYSLLLI